MYKTLLNRLQVSNNLLIALESITNSFLFCRTKVILFNDIANTKYVVILCNSDT